MSQFSYSIYDVDGNPGYPALAFTGEGDNVYFLGKLIAEEGNDVQTDRTGRCKEVREEVSNWLFWLSALLLP